jgi:phthiocerol/phenolphthiocerol synthesis type-I polyketide synthase E
MNHSEDTHGWSGSEIAIIGMAGRFPGAPGVEALWNNVRDGVESVTFFSDEQLLASGVDPQALQEKRYIKAGFVLDGIEMFDSSFFGFSPREAGGIDPQQRLFLECVWEAIEAAGYDVKRYNGSIGMFAGAAMSSYLFNNLLANPEACALSGMQQSFLSNMKDALTTLVAYKLNLKGACYTVSTFCSTSLVAVHLACQGLLNFECDMAVAGGVRIGVPQHAGYWYEEGLIASPDGHCRPFDASAQGTVFGSGLGVVVLKRLSDALADGDRIEAVILGSATNNDGSLKVGYMAPSVAGQSEVIVEALTNAGVSPETISYVEAHGTGTALGDTTEMTALTRAFRSGTEKKGFCAIGSVKSNLGHLDVAAGVTGLIKTVLSLKNKLIPPTLHFHKPNPNIDFENSPFFVNSALTEWKSDGAPRRAAVSSFGIGGTNAHVVLQEAPVAPPSGPSRPQQLLVFSAKTKAALEMATRNAIEFFKSNPELNLADAAYTLQTGRGAFNHRKAVVCQDIWDAVASLEAPNSDRVLAAYQEKRDPAVAFLFSGSGAQYVGMASELYRTEPVFREQVDHCAKLLQSHVSFDVRQILYPDAADAEEAGRRLIRPSVFLVVLFVVEYALARLWMAWGVRPAAMLGHSNGEYVAACVAGVFSLEDALGLVAARGRLMETVPAGEMLSVRLPENAVRSLIENTSELSIGAINGPSYCTVAGPEKAVKEFKERLSEMNIDCRLLRIAVASHSGMMDPVLDAFADEVRRTKRNPPGIPFVSNVTGTWITPEQAVSPEYWAKHLRQTVRFSDGIRELLKEPNRVFLEVGPGNSLTSLTKQHLSEAEPRVVLSSVRHPHEATSDVAFLLNTLGRLWINGVAIDWNGFYEREKRQRVFLPTYPFERRRHWIDPTEAPRGYFASRSGLCRKAESLPSTGDLDNALDELAPRDSELQSVYVAPQTQLEEILAGVWQEFFGIEKIGTRDNFFDLGGDSLSGTRLIARVRSLFRADLPPNTLFSAPTIDKLAAYMIAREARPGLTEKTAGLVKQIRGMSQQEVNGKLRTTAPVA